MTIGSQTPGVQTFVPSAAAARRRGRRLASGLALAAALAGLSACSAYDEVFGDEPVPGVVTTGSGAQQDAVVPSLASVPQRPAVSTAAQRQALQESLRRDRDQAVYADEPAAGPPSAAAAEITGGVARPTLPPAGREQGAIETQTGRGEPSPTPAPEREPAARPAPEPVPQPAREPGRMPAQAPQAAAPSAVGPAQIAQYNLPQRPSYSELAGVIFFRYGSSGLDNRDLGVLRQIVEMQRQRGGRLRVVGHASMRTGVTDPVKHNLANFNMSLKRAQAVASRLEALGAPPVVVEAMGSAQPVYYEFMPTGEAGNRRAEIFLDY